MSNNKILSVVIPVFNEEGTILELLGKVRAVDLGEINKEIIIVDDGSTDGTRAILRAATDCRIIFQDKNKGKGAALRRGFAEATGDWLVVQDADLEYNPEDYHILLQPLLENKADMVFGSRFMGNQPRRVLFFWHFLGNKMLTLFSNVLSDLNLTDMETCYKVFTKEAINKILPRLTSERFNIEPEITALAAKEKLRIFEVGVSYYGRTYAEGKKIGWKDGILAILAIIKFNLFR
ncbi:MAG: Glycosyltransferases involved in cell wall biogenesis [Candidatus Magasanikbacteria bacterium GW2011_GWC2_41_17]|uniref:Glycosyltransferases involved in cell wall biogenesis n=2 Tax=Candidatus Magasanikiibacteriota TaxID=1752731 RepID=A0A0G0WLN8_9BACT|nr:MAG: Glycosyltransferases involved in cell wall biogenesis [Candidatus Magasanikbacteria bacterium GW2011_GWC2_41_17]KKS13664.1 MAG: Glycosyltransferases involved in cell wall biogenesis [Candidatus Magasanikbacteria bacterium GW2011_GWA2_41_55]